MNDDLRYFDALFTAAQLISAAIDLDGEHEPPDHDRDAWFVVAEQAVAAWGMGDPDGQDRWLTAHEHCDCPRILRALLVRFDQAGLR